MFSTREVKVIGIQMLNATTAQATFNGVASRLTCLVLLLKLCANIECAIMAVCCVMLCSQCISKRLIHCRE